VTKVAVIGAGSWGTTVASLLAPRVDTVLWARREAVAEEIRDTRRNSVYLGDFELPERLAVTSTLEEALGGASFVVLAVPSHGVRAVLEEAAGFVDRDAVVLSLVKGLERVTNARTSEVVAQCWRGRPVGVLTGPNLASEVLGGQPTASVIAMEDEPTGRELQSLLSSDRLRVYTNSDVVGCEIAGVVKNVMAIACGMATGLGFGDNTRAALITRSLAELTRIGVALGGEERTFAGLAGVGDLVATCTSEKSRNFAIGVALGRGRALVDVLAETRMIAEGVLSSEPTVALAHRLGVEAPVSEEVAAVCFGGRAPAETIPRLMGRAVRPEFDPSRDAQS